MSEEVQEICQRYGQHYNKGSLVKQFGQVCGRILRYALPSKAKAVKSNLVTIHADSRLEPQETKLAA
jgi:linoleoyl-CoA desaturase